MSSLWDIQKILSPENLIFTHLENKNHLFSFLAKQAVNSGIKMAEGRIIEMLWEREALMDTGIGLGIAIPHLRIDGLSQVNVFLLFNDCDVSGYESIDDRPVRIIVFILVGTHMQTEYLRVLSSAVKLLKNQTVREAALACPDAASAHRVITGKI